MKRQTRIVPARPQKTKIIKTKLTDLCFKGISAGKYKPLFEDFEKIHHRK